MAALKQNFENRNLFKNKLDKLLNEPKMIIINKLIQNNYISSYEQLIRMVDEKQGKSNKNEKGNDANKKEASQPAKEVIPRQDDPNGHKDPAGHNGFAGHNVHNGLVLKNSPGLKEDATSVQDTECLICLDRIRTVICYPCSHNVMCLKCATEITTRPLDKQLKNCPVCRAKISHLNVIK